MLRTDIPQFGIYRDYEYLLSEVIYHGNDKIVYKLPPTDSSWFNIVLHGLLELKLGEEATAIIEMESDFDA